MTLLIVIECNLIGIKRNFFFYGYEFSYSVACNFSEPHIFELFGMSNKISSEHPTRHLRINYTLFKITNRCLLVKTLKMLRIPCVL